MTGSGTGTCSSGQIAAPGVSSTLDCSNATASVLLLSGVVGSTTLSCKTDSFGSTASSGNVYPASTTTTTQSIANSSLHSSSSAAASAATGAKDYGGLDFKIIWDSKSGPAKTIHLVAPSMQEKAAWVSDISQVRHLFLSKACKHSTKSMTRIVI